MPRRPSTASTPAELRRLQARVPELSVPALLSVRDAIAAALERERLEPDDVESVLRATEPR